MHLHSFKIPFFVLLLLLSSNYTQAQFEKEEKKLLKSDSNDEHNISLLDGNTMIHARVTRKTHKAKEDKFLEYYWYKGNKIHITQGGFDGKLLHGDFKVYYENTGDLKRKGEFKYGVRVGTWKEWYPNGKLEKVIEWKKGLQHGLVMEFDSLGRTTMEGNYKKGEKHGWFEYYDSEGKTVKRIKYRNGEEKKSEGTGEPTQDPEIEIHDEETSDDEEEKEENNVEEKEEKKGKGGLNAIFNKEKKNKDNQ